MTTPVEIAVKLTEDLTELKIYARLLNKLSEMTDLQEAIKYLRTLHDKASFKQ